jgi:hypothetical protein
MLHLSGIAALRDEQVALETCAEGARLALACPFSSSDEFEAAIIRERRAAGAYGPSARRRHWLWASALAVLIGLILIAAV